MHQSRAVSALILVAVLWGVNSMLFRMSKAPPEFALLCRSLISILILLPILGKEAFQLSRKTLLLAFLFGLSTSAWLMSLHFLPVAVALPITKTSPFFAMVFVLGSGKKVQLSEFALALLAMLGITLSSWGPLSSTSWFGILLALITAVSFAIYATLAGSLKKNEPLRLVFWLHILVFLSFLPYAPQHAQIDWGRQGIWLLALGIGTVSSQCILSFAAPLVKPHITTSLLTLDSVVGAALAAIFLGEALTPQRIIGGLMVIISVAWLKRIQSQS